MRNKKGQFYIIAAILIVVAIVGLTTMSTYAQTKPKPRAIESMGSELKEEGFRLIDYGILRNEDIIKIIDDFSAEDYKDYFLEKTDNANIIMIYGNQTVMNATEYDTASVGNIRATIGGSTVIWPLINGVVKRTTIDPADPITISLLGQDYKFQINNNEMFYFIIMQNKEGERYIEKDG